MDYPERVFKVMNKIRKDFGEIGKIKEGK